MSKKFFLKKIIKATSIGAIISLTAASLSFLNTKDVNLNQTNSISLMASKSIGTIPSETSNASSVNTDVAIIKTGNVSYTPGEYYQHLVDTKATDELKSYFQIYFYDVIINPLNNKYIPVSDTTLPNYSITNVTPDNQRGVLSLEITVNNIVVNAVKTTESKKFTIEIDNFKTVSGATSVSLNSNFPFNQTQKMDLVNNVDLLKAAILVKNKPDIATYDYTIDQNTITQPGILDVIVKTPLYYDSNYNLVSDPNKTFNVRLAGLLTTPETTITAKTNINKDTYAASIDKSLFLNLVDINSLPPAATKTIIFDEQNGYDNKNGSISFSIKVSQYFQAGYLCNEEKQFPVTITGFKKITEYSTFKPIANLTFIPSNVNINNLEQYVDISSFPNDVTFSGGTFLANDKQGTLTISDVVASKGFSNDKLYTLTNDYTVPQITISGLETIKPTIITVKDNDLNNDVLATEINEGKILNDYIEFENLPTNTTKTITDLVYDNLTGRITFKLKLSQYYDANGLLVSNYEKEYTINNFKIIKPSTISQNPNADMNFYATDINLSNVNDYVLKNDFPDGTNFYGFKFENATNITGSVSVSFFVNKWYDEKGFLQPFTSSSEKNKKFTIELTGFLTNQKTEIRRIISDVSDVLASSITSNDDIKNFFVIDNPSKDPNYPTTWYASNIVSDNLKGTLSFNLIVNNYYNDQGVLIISKDENYEPLILNLTFNDFKKVVPSEIKQIAFPDTILPTSMTSDEVKKYIDISSFPDNASLTYQITNQRNIDGTFDLIVMASQWYDIDGSLINTPNQFVLEITGGKTQNPTTISQTSNSSISNIIASSVDTLDELVNLNLIKFENAYGTMNPGTNWTATNFNPNNINGTLSVDIKVNEYFDELGNPMLTSSNAYTPLIKTIEIQGFRPTTLSSLSQIKTDAFIYPTEAQKNNTWKNFIDFSSFPSNYQINNVSLTPNNKLGTLYVNLIIVNYYDENGELITNEPKPFAIQLKDFKKQTEITNIIPVDSTDDTIDVLTIEEMVEKNPTLFFDTYVKFIGLPQNPNPQITFFSKDPKQGSVTITISLDNYYDYNGNEASDYSKTITIYGFKKIKPTTFKQDLTVDCSNISALEFTNDFNNNQLTEKEKIFKKYVIIDSLPDDATFLSLNASYINSVGQVTINYIISKTYNSNCDYEFNSFGSVILQGFTRINQSVLVELLFDKSFPPSDFQISVSNFWNYFDKSKFPNDVIVNAVNIDSYNNAAGTVTISAKLSKVYSIDGNLSDNPKTLTYTISDFVKITKESQLILKNNNSSLSNKYAWEIISEAKGSEQYLFDWFVDTSSFPQANDTKNITGTEFTNIQFQSNDEKGELIIWVKASKFYLSEQQNYSLSTNPNIFSVTVSGFKKANASSIEFKNNKNDASLVTFDDLIFINFPKEPTADEVKINPLTNNTFQVIVNGDYFTHKGQIGQVYSQIITIFIPENKDQTWIIALSASLGSLAVLAGIGYVWWRHYKKTHEV